MDILLTFAGNRDPFNPEVVKGVFSDGPVLTLLAEHSFVLSGGNVIKETDLPPEILSLKPPTTTAQVPQSNSSPNPTASITTGAIPPEGFDLGAHLLAAEKTLVVEALRLKDGNRQAAARLLKMKPHTFRKRAKEKFGL